MTCIVLDTGWQSNTSNAVQCTVQGHNHWLYDLFKLVHNISLHSCHVIFFQKKEVTFANPVREAFADHFEALRWSSLTKSFTRTFWSILILLKLFAKKANAGKCAQLVFISISVSQQRLTVQKLSNATDGSCLSIIPFAMNCELQRKSMPEQHLTGS